MTRRLKYVMGIIIMSVLGTTMAVAGTHAIQTTFLVTNLNDSGPGSLRQAILDANATLGEDVIHITAIGTVNLLSALPTITEAVTIFVQDAHVFRIFRVDGQNQYRGLNIANVPVTISGLIVLNAVAFGTAPGGGINSEGDLTLNAVHVLNSSAGSGGGVYSTGSIVVNGGRYEGNSSLNDGGAIYAEGALTVNGSIIQDNQCWTAFCQGGGLYTENTVTLANTQILSNTNGGVVAIGAAVITGTLFISNTASSSGGGAAMVGSGPVQVTNSRFENNSSGGSGGGLFSNAAMMTLNNVDFVGNHTFFQGGGLYAEVVLIINGGRFEQNTALGSGGGLYGYNVLLTDTHFISNTADFIGGASVSTDIVVTGSSFEYNVGGALGANGRMVLTDTQFLNNSDGPTAFASSTQATNVLFANNNHNALDSGETTISNSQFMNNARGIVVQGPMTVTNSLFMNNAPFGAIQAYNNVTISSTLFLGNSAPIGGGVAQYATGDVSIVNTLFAGNTASESGAAVSLADEGTATLKHVTIASSEFVTTTAITTSKDIVLIQNTIVANHDIGLNVTTGFVALNHALFHDNGLDIQGSVALDENRVTGDPLFVSPGADDYRLQPGSPAIDAGLDAGIVADFEGDERPSLDGFDVGYDEFVPIRVLLPIILR